MRVGNGNTGPLPELPPQRSANQSEGVVETEQTQTVPTDGEGLDATRFSAAETAAVSTPFDTEASPAILQQSIADFDGLPRVQQQRLNELAFQLDFPNGRTLSHALRNLPPEHLTPFLEAAFGDNAEAQTKEIARNAVNELFRELDAPPPDFHSEKGAQWNAAGYLAVYNSVQGLKDSLPAQRLQAVLSNDEGDSLRFTRASHPAPSENPNSLLSVLSNSMKIAGTDGHNEIMLYDAALSMDPKDILKNEQLLGYLERIEAEQPDAVSSLQSMLNAALPESRQIPLNGEMDVNTWAALSEFDHQQMLREATDILRDSCQSEQRDALIDAAEDLQSQVYEHGVLKATMFGQNSVSAIETLLDRMDGEGVLSPAGSDRLQRLRDEFNLRVSSTNLRPRQLERLVSNWFGIMDSGQQFDFTEQVISHEFGHHLHNEERLLQNWSQISFRDFEQSETNMDEFMGSTLSMNIDSGFGTEYARLNPREDFAESFRLFQHRPEQLLESNPLKFLFMAGATGAYEGREEELVNFMQEEGGYSPQDLQAVVRHLRGQTGEYYAQNVQRYGQMGVNIIRNPIVQSTLRGISSAFPGGSFVHELANKYVDTERLTDMASNMAAEYAEGLDPDFDSSISGMLPGLENALNMESIQSVTPQQEGFVIDYLREKFDAIAAGPGEAAENAAEFIENFRKNGLEAFPERFHNQFPAETRERLQSDQNRAFYITLAYRASNPAIENALRPESLPQDETSLSSDYEIQINHYASQVGDAINDAMQAIPEALSSFFDGKSSPAESTERFSAEQIENTSFWALEMQGKLSESANIMEVLNLVGSAFTEENGRIEVVQNQETQTRASLVINSILSHLSPHLTEQNRERISEELSSELLAQFERKMNQGAELPRDPEGNLLSDMNFDLSQILAAEASAFVLKHDPRISRMLN